MSGLALALGIAGTVMVVGAVTIMVNVDIHRLSNRVATIVASILVAGFLALVAMLIVALTALIQR